MHDLQITGPIDITLVHPCRPFVFGRAADADLTLDPSDRSISRTAGSFECDATHWYVHNRSTTRPLYTLDSTGLRVALAVGQHRQIPVGGSSVIVVGSRLTHTLTLDLWGGEPDPTATAERRFSPSDTMIPTLTDKEHLAVLALAETYLLDPPRHVAAPRSYADAAARLGCPTATVRKRIERARSKLVDAGIIELERPDARAALCEFCLTVGLITRAQLSALDLGAQGSDA